MSDFLQTLIARNSSTPPPAVLQPRLPSLFENMEAAVGPALLTEMNEEQAGAASQTDKPVSRLSPQPDHRLQSETSLDPKRNRLNLADEIATLDREAAKTVRPPEIGSQRPEQTPVFSETRRSSLVRPQDTIIPSEPVNANPQQTPQSGAFIRPATLPAGQVSKPASTRQAQVNRVEPAEQETTIRVQIGRIEVRAVTAPAPSQAAPRAPKSKPTLSLDDYLKQRSEGKR